MVVRTVADLLFNLHYGPALEQLTATQLDAEGLLAFTRESVETVSLQLGCCAKRSRAPRHDADNEDSTGALTSASRVASAVWKPRINCLASLMYTQAASTTPLCLTGCSRSPHLSLHVACWRSLFLVSRCAWMLPLHANSRR